MKKYTLALFVVLSFVVSSPTFAMTQQEIQSQIQVLMQKVQTLQAQLGVSTGVSVGVASVPVLEKTFCFNFNQNLTVGDGMTGRDDKDADVLALQTILEKEGFSIDDSEQKGGAQFGESTAAAVVKFQAAHGIIQTGYVGPLTRAALNTLYKCSAVVTTPSITVLSPNGGEAYAVGQYLNMKWRSNGINSNEKILVSVNRIIPTQDMSTQDMHQINTTNTGFYNWMIPSDIIPGQYQIEIVFLYGNGDAVKDVSNAYFTIASLATSAPVISGVSGPQLLTANQSGTWKVDAYDVNGGNLSYAVDWGDTNKMQTCALGIACVTAKISQQSSSFTHTYSQTGTYTITFTVTNANKQSSQTTLTVSVGGTAVVSCVALPTCAQGYTPGDSYIDSNGCKSFNCVPVSVVSTCLGTSQDVVEAALGNPGGTGPFEKLGLDISAHPEIIKYRIQWFTGVWSDWYTPGVNDRDWNNNLDGTPRRVWSYFDDHVHEYIKCNAVTTIPTVPATPVEKMYQTSQIQASALDSMKELLNQMLKAFQ